MSRAHDCDPTHCCECNRCADLGMPGDGRCIRCGKPDSAETYDVCDDCDRHLSAEAVDAYTSRLTGTRLVP